LSRGGHIFYPPDDDIKVQRKSLHLYFCCY
jgi:hypothetical protein